MKVFSEYNNFITEPAGTTWSSYYTDSQILQGKATGPLPVPTSAVSSYADIPSLNAVDYHPYPAFDLAIPTITGPTRRPDTPGRGARKCQR